MPQPPIQNPKSQIQNSYIPLLLAYLLLALWLTWPAAAAFGSQYFTGGERIFFFPDTPDAPQNIWNFWWAARALDAGRSLWFADLLYYPEGVQMALQTLNPLAVTLALPVTLTLGPTAAYNLTAIVAVALTGYAGFWLARAFAPGVVGPFLAGALLAAAPFHIAKLDSGQLNFVTMQWLVLFMLAFVHLCRGQGRRGPPLAALAYGAVLYTDWYWALVGAAFAAVWAGLSMIGAARPRALLVRCLAFGALSLALALPLLAAARAAGESLPRDPNEMWLAYTLGYSADALGLFFPAARHPLWAAPVERFLVSVAPLSITEGSYTAAGWTLLALAIPGMIWYGRRHWRLLVVALLAWLLAVGPTLHVLGHDTGLPMPYRLFQSLPLLGTARRPNLFGVITIVVAAVFAALALNSLRERLAPRGFARLLVAVAALGALELWPPARVPNVLPRPEVFTRIAAEPGVVVDLPLERGTDSRTLIHQMVHGQPMLRGYVARPPVYPTLAHSPLPAQLGQTRVWPDDDIVALDPEALAVMQCYYRLRYLVLEPGALTAEQEAAVLEVAARLHGAPLEPWYTDAHFRAYRLPLHADRCAPFVFLGNGWNSREGQGETVWRWSTGRSELYLVNPEAELRAVTLDLLAEGREEGQPLTIRHAGRVVAELRLARPLRRYRVALLAPPGQSRWELLTPPAPDPASNREVGFAARVVKVVGL